MFNVQRVRSVVLRVLAGLMVLVTNLVAAGASNAAAAPACAPLTDFNPKDFSNPTKIDNQYYPLVPGTQFILDGSINTGSVSTAHRVVFTVTDLTKVINGVRTRVLWDTDTNAGQLVESELAFQAQDNDGNVWVIGEYPEEYDAGVFIGAPNTWIADIDRAKAGVLVPGRPKVETPAFLEGFSPKIHFWDCGQVSAMNQTISGPNKSYQNVLVVNEWAPLDPTGGTQQKYYAPGVGNVQIGALNDPEAETLVLTRIVHLNPRALAEVREEALKLDRHGYEVSAVYSQTPPAELTPSLSGISLYSKPTIVPPSPHIGQTPKGMPAPGVVSPFTLATSKGSAPQAGQ